LAGENSVLAFRREGEMQGIVLRLTNGFGAPVHRDANCWSLLINGLCRQAVEESHMTLLSSGLQHRDFIAISAVCRSIEGIINRNVEAKIPGVINVGFGVSQSVRGIAQLIQQRCQVVLGFSPHLTWPESADIEQHLPLVYRSKGLEELNIAVQSDNPTEVDDLLKFCASTFSKRPCGASGPRKI
jgi:UDP-glucose 4-epimerase